MPSLGTYCRHSSHPVHGTHRPPVRSAPLLNTQDYPADITRGKDVYQRNCQACHGVGAWGDGPDAKASRWHRPIFTALCPF